MAAGQRPCSVPHARPIYVALFAAAFSSSVSIVSSYSAQGLGSGLASLGHRADRHKLGASRPSALAMWQSSWYCACRRARAMTYSPHVALNPHLTGIFQQSRSNHCALGDVLFPFLPEQAGDGLPGISVEELGTNYILPGVYGYSLPDQALWWSPGAGLDALDTVGDQRRPGLMQGKRFHSAFSPCLYSSFICTRMGTRPAW